MRRHPLRTLLVAAVAALTLVVASGAPAAAATNPVEISGWMTAAGNVISLNPWDVTPPCSNKADTTVLTTNAGGTWSMTGGFTRYFQLGFPPAGPWYQADVLILGAEGSWSGSSSPYFMATVAPNHIVFRLRIYQVGPGSCEKSNLKCIITSKIVGQGDFVGSLPTPAIGDTGYTSGASNNAGGINMVTSSCSAPFVSWSGQVLSFAPFRFTV